MSHTSAQPGFPGPHVVDGMDRHPKERGFIEVDTIYQSR